MRCVAVGVALMLLTACGTVKAGDHPRPDSTPAAAHTFAVATGLDTANANAAALSGMLRGHANGDGTACFWVENRGVPRIAILWPHGSYAADRPLRVLDQQGNVLGIVNHDISIGGGAVPRPRMPLKGCPGLARAFGG